MEQSKTSLNGQDGLIGGDENEGLHGKGQDANDPHLVSGHGVVTEEDNKNDGTITRQDGNPTAMTEANKSIKNEGICSSDVSTINHKRASFGRIGLAP